MLFGSLGYSKLRVGKLVRGLVDGIIRMVSLMPVFSAKGGYVTHEKRLN